MVSGFLLTMVEALEDDDASHTASEATEEDAMLDATMGGSVARATSTVAKAIAAKQRRESKFGVPIRTKFVPVALVLVDLLLRWFAAPAAPSCWQLLCAFFRLTRRRFGFYHVHPPPTRDEVFAASLAGRPQSTIGSIKDGVGRLMAARPSQKDRGRSARRLRARRSSMVAATVVKRRESIKMLRRETTGGGSWTSDADDAGAEGIGSSFEEEKSIGAVARGGNESPSSGHSGGALVARANAPPSPLRQAQGNLARQKDKDSGVAKLPSLRHMPSVLPRVSSRPQVKRLNSSAPEDLLSNDVLARRLRLIAELGSNATVGAGQQRSAPAEAPSLPVSTRVAITVGGSE